MTPQELDQRFRYAIPTRNHQKSCAVIEGGVMQLAVLLNKWMPESPDKEQVFWKLQELRLLATNGVKINPDDSLPDSQIYGELR